MKILNVMGGILGGVAAGAFFDGLYNFQWNIELIFRLFSGLSDTVILKLWGIFGVVYT